ncbi:MAG: aspartate aminotransferase family protein [Dichotomicrobium sp.]
MGSSEATALPTASQSTSSILHRQPGKTYPRAVSGKGAFLYDAAGKDYLDASGGAAVSALGHGHPRVIAAVKAQLDTLAYAHNAFFTTDAAEELADRLVTGAPEGIGRAMFVSGGSEAVEAAIKLARQVHYERGDTGRVHFIARRQSYHGNTLGALALGHHPARRAPYEALIGHAPVSHIAPCYAYRHQRDDETPEEYGLRAAGELEAEILRLGPETVAGFVAETVSGATMGAVPPAPGYLAQIRAICDRYGVFLILDEVMSGMGRTGHLFACAEDGVSPDFIAVAKGLGAGYQPIGAVLAREAHVQTIETGSGALAHGHTYMAHAAACAGALAVQHVIEEEGLLARVREQGARLRVMLRRRFGDHPNIGDIRGRGLFLAMEFVADRASKTPLAPQRKFAARLKEVAIANGLICYPASGTADGVSGDHVLLAPPFNISEDELALLVERLDASIDETLARTAHVGDK